MTCKTCDATLYQEVPHVDDDHYITERLRDDLRLSAVNRPFRDAVRMHAVEETLVKRVFRKFADEQLLKYRFKAPRVLGIDENSLLGDMRGVIVDVEAAKLLDVYPGRTQSDIPQAAIVVDKFHVLTKADLWFMKVRQAETNKLPLEMRKKMPGMIRVFDMHWEGMTTRQQDRVAEVLSYSKRLSDAWAIKESFYYWYESPIRADAEAAYTQWVQFVREKDQMAEWKPLMTMVQRWRKHIFNYFDHRFTSGVVERMNRSIADINRAGNGMDFQTLRAKAILRYGNLIPEERFKLFFMDAFSIDDDDDDTVLVGSGFDPSTLIADLEAGVF